MTMKPDSVNYVATQDNTLRGTAAPSGRCRNSWAPTMVIICFAVASSLPPQELESRVSFQTDGNDNADAAISRQLTILRPCHCMMGAPIGRPWPRTATAPWRVLAAMSVVDASVPAHRGAPAELFCETTRSSGRAEKSPFCRDFPAVTFFRRPAAASRNALI